MRNGRIKTIPGNHRRGVTMLGMMALTVLLATWCGLILDRSHETYRAGAMLEWRLQARAAAEGMAVLLADDPRRPSRPQTLGAAVVTCGAGTATAAGEWVVPLEVAIRPAGAVTPRYSARYRARWIQNNAGWHLLRLEE